MADPDPRADGANPPDAETNAPEFSLQSVYLKDCSFEAPKGPRVDGPWNPQIGLDLNTASEVISGSAGGRTHREHHRQTRRDDGFSG